MRLSVEGYKSILNEQSINLDGLAIISGSNSTGKSSFMQPFLILKQTLENNTDGFSLVINGENTNLTEKQQIFNKNKSEQSFSVGVRSIKNKKMETAKSTFHYDSKDGFIASESVLIRGDKEIKVKRKMSSSEVQDESKKIEDGDRQNPFAIFERMDFPEKNITWQVGKGKPFLTLELQPKTAKESKVRFSMAFNPNEKLEDFVKNIIHVPGIRSNPERQYKLERYTSKYQGRFDKYVASIIYKWCSGRDKKLDKLKEILSYLDLASNIEANKINEAQISVNISRTMKSEDDDMVNLSDVGFGISQVLPVIVALIEANKRNIVFIEQPEIHLHPKAQFKLAKVICDFIRENKKIIVETHSSIFIRGIQIEVAEGALSPNLFSLNWFSQDDLGSTVIYEAELDSNGAFGDWPEDFDDTYLYVEDRYLNAVEKNMLSELGGD